MVQTRAGASNSEWVNFIKECAAEYHARKKGTTSSKLDRAMTNCACRRKAVAPEAVTKKPARPLEAVETQQRQGVNATEHPEPSKACEVTNFCCVCIQRDALEELMSKRKWIKKCLRANVAQPEDIQIYGTVKVANIYSNVLNEREKEPELYDAIKEVAPEWWGDDTQITLNKDLVCKRHRDHANKEHSWILWLGDFTGGALHFDDGSKIEGKGVWHKINGHIHHWNDLHEGTKYSIVLYRRTRTPKSNKLVEAKRAKREKNDSHREGCDQ